MSQLVGALCLVRHTDEGPKILVMKRGMTAPWMPGAWNLPGGTHEQGETVHQTAIRELEEETGISGVKMSNSPVHVHKDPEGWVAHYFVAEDPQNRDPGPGDGENDGWKFVGQQEAQGLNYASPSILTAMNATFKQLSSELLESWIREILR